MATLVQVEKVQTEIISGETESGGSGGGGDSLSNTVTVANTFVVVTFSSTGTSGSPSNDLCILSSLTTNNITFERQGTSNQIDITAYVCEFSAGVDVETGIETTWGANPTLSSAMSGITTLTGTFMLGTYNNDGGAFRNDDYLHGSVISSSGIKVEMGGTGSLDNEDFQWQVIQYDDATTQHGTASLTTGTSTTASITAVDQTKAFCIIHQDSDDTGTNDLHENMLEAYFSANDELTFVRNTSVTSDVDNIDWQVIEFDDSVVVDKVDVDFADTVGSDSNTLSITLSGTDQAFAIASNNQTRGQGGHSSNDAHGHFSAELNITSTTNLTANRSITDEATSITAFAVDLGASSADQTITVPKVQKSLVTKAPTLTGISLLPPKVQMSLTTKVPSVSGSSLLVPKAQMSLTTNAPTLVTGGSITVPKVQMSMTTNVPEVITGFTAIVPKVTMSLVTKVPTVEAFFGRVDVTKVTWSLVTKVPTVAASASVVVPPRVIMSLVTKAPTVSGGAVITASKAALSLTTKAPSLNSGASISVEKAVMSLTTNAPKVVVSESWTEISKATNETWGAVSKPSTTWTEVSKGTNENWT